MPFGDLTVSSGKLVRWLKRTGDKVLAAELVAEIETDKAVVEIEAPRAGVIAEQLYEPGETVEMGAVLAVIGGQA
jgi:2-oxoisovalerate dehydrogenase E1 component